MPLPVVYVVAAGRAAEVCTSLVLRSCLERGGDCFQSVKAEVHDFEVHAGVQDGRVLRETNRGIN